jgi:Mss4 protein
VHRDRTKKDAPAEVEALQFFWQLRSIMSFDNVCVSRGVTGSDLKYLTCAECERGIFGVHFLPSHPTRAGQILVAHSRVQHRATPPEQEVAPALLSFARGILEKKASGGELPPGIVIEDAE